MEEMFGEKRGKGGQREKQQQQLKGKWKIGRKRMQLKILTKN